PASRPRICALCFLFMIAPPPTPTLFPYTTLFRSYRKKKNCWRQDIRKGEYLTGCLGAVGAAGLTALLFYRSTVAALVLLLPVGGTFLYVWEKEKLRRKEREFTRQFLDALQSVSAALNVGYS